MSQIKGRVVKILSQTMLAINIGAEAGVSEGMLFVIQSAPLEITDVDGKDLGGVSFSKGRVRATRVFGKFSLVQTDFVPMLGLGVPADFGFGGRRETLRIREEDLADVPDPYAVRFGDMVVSLGEPERTTGGSKQTETKPASEQPATGHPKPN
jgi:hypothetical protein